MAEASVAFALGLETVTSVIEIDLGPVETILTGDIDAVVAAGTVARLVAPARLINNLHVRGTLKNDPNGVIDFNGFDVHTHDGGVLDLAGIEKTAWLRWGDTPVGWVVGDRLAVAPTTPGTYVPSEMTWTGSWATMVRPVKSPDVTLVDGTIARPEVANLSQTFVIENADRIMMHESSVPNVHTLKWLKVLNAGKSLADAGELGHYPIHFHTLGDTTRGSLVEGVVVEGGKNHAFVVHGSHGVTLRDTVAYKTTDVAYWWDSPLDKFHTANNSNDAHYEHVMGMWVLGTALRLSAFLLGAGHGNSIVDSVMSCVQGGKEAAGFAWPEAANQNVGGLVWDFSGNITHNNKSDGINTWQNDGSLHVVSDGIAYHNGLTQIDHGAYGNRYTYRDWVLKGGSEGALRLHAVGDILLEDIYADQPLVLFRHQKSATEFATVRNCQFGSPGLRVQYKETGESGLGASWMRYEDLGWVPADFDLSGIFPSSLIEILEGGVLVHRWANGVWT